MKYSFSVFLAAFIMFCGQQEPVSGGADLTTDAKEFVDLLAKGDYAGVVARFDSTMKSVMPESKVHDAWVSLQDQVGAYKKQIGLRQTKEQGWDCVYVTCEFERGRVDIKVVFDKHKKVSGLWFK
jgi:hypothetical protein